MSQAKAEEGVSFEEISRWPHTPGIERMERARSIVLQEEKAPGPQELEDARMLRLSMAANSYQPAVKHRLEGAPESAKEEMDIIVRMLLEIDTDLTFGAAIIREKENAPGAVYPRCVFGMVRNPGWMGASAHLPMTRGSRMLLYESPSRPGRTGALVSIPQRLGQRIQNEEPIPKGEPELLKELLAWHGAAAVHWIPARRSEAKA